MDQTVSKPYIKTFKSIERDASLTNNQTNNECSDIKNKPNVARRKYHTVPSLPWLENKTKGNKQ